MKRLILMVLCLAVIMAAAPAAAGDQARHGSYGDGGGYYMGLNSGGFSFSISVPGEWYEPPRHERSYRREWAPGHWEVYRVWVPDGGYRQYRSWSGDRHDRDGRYDRHDRGDRYDRDDHGGRRWRGRH